MRKKHYILVLTLFCSILSFSQTKKELIDKVARQKTTIDSLNKVIDNMENIIENRDRSVKLMQGHRDEISEQKDLMEKKVRQKNTELVRMRKQFASGTYKIMTLSNNRSTLKVKDGKYWTINQFMADYTSGITTDTTGKVITEEVHVFLKSIDDNVLTDTSKNMYGPKLYSSLHPEHTIQFPIVFTENIRFSIIVLKGEMGSLLPYAGDVQCSFSEKDK